MQNNHQKNNRKFDKSNSKSKPFPKQQANGQSKSLLERLANAQTSNDKENYQSGKLLITKLVDIVQNKCIFGNRCAHLRARGECSFLHQKKDFQALEIPLPQKYLENEQPLKKSKQERKQDKIREKAEREKRLQEKLNRQQVRQVRQQKQQREQGQKQQAPVKMIQQKVMDQKQLVVQRIVKPTEGQQLTINYIYSQLNLITSAISQLEKNAYSEQFNFKQLKLTLHEVRKRLLMKLKKNKQFESIYKAFTQKQGAIVKKLIKNINTAYPDMIEEIKDAQKWKNVDLRQIQQTFTVDDINRVLNLKKENSDIIEYYSRLFNEQYGFPVSFQSIEEEQIEIRQGGLLPLTKFYLIPVITSNFSLQRVFLSLNLSFSELKALTEFSSMLIPQQIAQKSPVQKTYCIDLNSISYSKFVEQIMAQHMNDYHEKIKGPAKEFEFGKIQDNLKKYRTFLAKQKEKIIKMNKDNSFVLIVFNIKSFIEKIESLGLGQNLDYDKIKKDRTMQEENTYQKIFLLREFINIIGENDQSKLKVIYVTPNKKFKPKNHKEILSSIDKNLIDKQEQEEIKEE